MKNSITLIALMMSFTFATAQTKTITLQTAGKQINSINASNAFKVDVRQGTVSSAVMTVSDQFADDVVFSLDTDGELKIGMKRGVSINGNQTLQVEVVCPTFNDIDVSSAAVVEINSAFSIAKLEIDASSAARVICNANVTVKGECSIDASSAAKVEMKGSANHLDADASSAAKILCADFVAQTANAEASSAATIEVKATKTLNAEASSGAEIQYDCPQNGVKINTGISSSIKKM